MILLFQWQSIKIDSILMSCIGFLDKHLFYHNIFNLRIGPEESITHFLQQFLMACTQSEFTGNIFTNNANVYNFLAATEGIQKILLTKN